MVLRAIAVLVLFLFGLPAAAGGLYTSADKVEFGPETLSLVRATEALFDAMEAESAAPGTPRLHLRALTGEAEPVGLPAAGQRALRSENGPVANLTAYQITWYPTDRLSGTVDFMGTWANGRNLVCGYATWDMTDPTAPQLAAMTTSYLDTRTLIRLPVDAAHAELLRANCAYGEIEPNLELARSPG
ncbi:MAG: hypothetical protein QNJ13_15970 [Paracoccaceae bacterium]|nr:hypothetical protein [Paracoccaceae bacterium]